MKQFIASRYYVNSITNIDSGAVFLMARFTQLSRENWPYIKGCQSISPKTNSPQPTRPIFMPSRPNQLAPHLYQLAPHICQLAPTNSPHIYAISPQPTCPTFIPTRPTYTPTRPNQLAPHLYQLAPHICQLAPTNFAPHYTNSPHMYTSSPHPSLCNYRLEYNETFLYSRFF